jgi:NitT/TauT family transport system permease protein
LSIDVGTAFSAALLLAVAFGLTIGLILGLNRVVGEVLEPMLVALYSIPKVTLYPILLLAFGLGLQAKIAFGAIHGFIPIALFTINAVRNVRPILIKTGRVLRMNRLTLVAKVIMPAALPEIFTGLRVGFALTMIGTVLGEMFASQRGLGYMLMNAIGLHNVDVIMSITLLLVIFAATVSSVLLAIDQRLHRRV